MNKTYQDSLARAENGMVNENYRIIIEELVARGVPEADITPRVNVLTYNAWQAKGRQVRRGEKSVRISVVGYRGPSKTEEGDEGTYFRKTAFVFHISQTDPINDEEK